MGSNWRYGDAISRQKDNARAEARALQPSSLPIDLVTTAGGPVTQADRLTPVTAYVEVGVTLIRVAGVATAWNTRCVHIRWTGTNPEPSEAWVWRPLLRVSFRRTPSVSASDERSLRQ